MAIESAQKLSTGQALLLLLLLLSMVALAALWLATTSSARLLARPRCRNLQQRPPSLELRPACSVGSGRRAQSAAAKRPLQDTARRAVVVLRNSERMRLAALRQGLGVVAGSSDVELGLLRAAAAVVVGAS